MSYWKKIKYVKEQGFDIDFLHTYIKNEEQNKAELLDYVELGDLKSQERFSNAINGLETEKIIQVLKTIHEQQKKKEVSAISKYAVCLVWIRTTTTSYRAFVSVEYSLFILKKPLFPISPKILFWLQTAIEHIEP